MSLLDEISAVLKLDNVEVAKTGWKMCSQQAWDQRFSIQLEKSRELELLIYWKDWRSLCAVKFLKLEEFVEAGFHETSQREKKLKRVERECHLYKKEVCKLRRKLARVAAAQFPWPNLCPACPRSFFLFEPLDEVLPEPDHNVQLGVRMSLGAARDEVFTEV